MLFENPVCVNKHVYIMVIIKICKQTPGDDNNVFKQTGKIKIKKVFFRIPKDIGI